jgi:hypothetical protein
MVIGRWQMFFSALNEKWREANDRFHAVSIEEMGDYLSAPI